MSDIRTVAAANATSSDHWWTLPTREELGLLAIKYRRVLLGIVVAILLMNVQARVTEMDARLFQSSSHGARGLAYYLIGSYGNAAKAYRAHLRDGGWREWAHRDTAYASLLQGDLSKASQEADGQPDDIDALVTRGEIALEQGDFRRAAALFGLALEQDENHFDALLLTSVAQSYAGDPNRAIDTLRRALRTNSAGQRITAFLWALQTIGNLQQEAPDGLQWCLIAHYYRYLRILDPSNAAPAAKAARRAIDLNGRADDAYVTLGVLEEKRGEYDAALPFFLKAIDINPRNAEAHRWAANIYRHRGSDLLNEYRMWKGAFGAAPADLFYRNSFTAFLSERFGDYPQALNLIQEALTQEPQNTDLLKRAANLNQRLGNHDQAIATYREVLALRPHSPDILDAIGTSLVFLERYDDAIRSYQEALAINASRPESHSGLGAAYARQNKSHDAIREYETALTLGGENIEVRSYLCGQYYMTDQYQKAESCLRQVLRSDPQNKAAMHIYPYVMKNLGKDPT
jgi:tetratricopeptide (TPR) repeat protein